MKDDKEIFQAAYEAVHCAPEECVFIDNKEKNLAVPKEMGFHTYWHDFDKNDIHALREWH